MQWLASTIRQELRVAHVFTDGIALRCTNVGAFVTLYTHASRKRVTSSAVELGNEGVVVG